MDFTPAELVEQMDAVYVVEGFKLENVWVVTPAPTWVPDPHAGGVVPG